MFKKSKPIITRIKNASEARKKSMNYVSDEINELLDLITGLASSGKTSVEITKKLNPDTIENLRLKEFKVTTPVGSSEVKHTISW